MYYHKILFLLFKTVVRKVVYFARLQTILCKQWFVVMDNNIQSKGAYKEIIIIQVIVVMFIWYIIELDVIIVYKEHIIRIILV